MALQSCGGGSGAALGADPGNAVPIESVAIVGSCALPDADPPNIQVVPDVQYTTAGGESLFLDIAGPSAPGSYPLVVFIHGGGWKEGDKSFYLPMLKIFAGIGYVAASVNYRLAQSPVNTFPAAVEDVRCAVRFLRANASLWHIDPRRVAAYGGSAGAHLAAMLGTAAGVSGLDGSCPLTGNVSVLAVVDNAGPMDLRASAPIGNNPVSDPVATLANFLGGSPQQLPDLAALASPIVHVNSATPAFFISHGTADDVVPIEQSRLMLAALNAVGVPATLYEIAGAGHEVNITPQQSQTHLCTTLAFLAARL